MNGRDIPEEMVPTDLVESVSEAVHEQWMATKRAQGVTSRCSESGEELMVPYGQLSEAAKDLDRGTVVAVLSALPVAGRTVVDLPEANGADETGTWWNHDHGAVIADDLCTADTARYMRRRAGALLAAAHHIEQRLRASGVGVGEQP